MTNERLVPQDEVVDGDFVVLEDSVSQFSALATLKVWRFAAPRSQLIPLALVIAVVAIGGLLRFWDLGSRAFHHDESLHAAFSWYFSEGRGYTHDPLMHGPFLFHSTALTFLLFGDGDYQARVVPALFGTALIGMAWLLRDRIGVWGAVALSIFLTFSPTLLYFSRFIRNDMFIAVWTLGLVIACWRYIDQRQHRYLIIAAALLSLSFATKETTFITAALFVLYFDLYAAWQLAEQTAGRDWPAWQQWLVFAIYAPFAWLIVALWPLIGGLRRSLWLEERTPVMDVLLLMGTLTLPQFAAVIGAPIEELGGGFAEAAPGWFRPTAGLEQTIGTVTMGALFTVGTLLIGTAAIGLAWNWRIWAVCGLVFYGIYFTLYTTFFTNMHGLSSGIWGSLDYWIEQHDVQRGNQPDYYYLMLLPVYEFLPLLLGAIAAIPLFLRGNAFTRFLLFWFGGSLLGFSVAGEKMPWLTVHTALPLAVIAAMAAGWLANAVTMRPGRVTLRPVLAGVGLVMAGVLTVGTARSAIDASFGHDADGARPVELLVYTQTSPELLEAFRKVEAYARDSGKGHNLTIYVDSSEGMSWPWAWYLRQYKNTRYTDFQQGFKPPPDAVALVEATHIIPLDLEPQTWNREMAYAHRWWFPEVYRGVTFDSFLSDIRRSSTWDTWRRYFIDRTLPGDSEIGRLNAVLYLPVARESP